MTCSCDAEGQSGMFMVTGSGRGKAQTRTVRSDPFVKRRDRSNRKGKRKKELGVLRAKEWAEEGRM